MKKRVVSVMLALCSEVAKNRRLAARSWRTPIRIEFELFGSYRTRSLGFISNVEFVTQSRSISKTGRLC